MSSYIYKARDKFAKLITGSMAADSEADAAIKLKAAGYLPISIREERKEKQIKLFDRFKGVKISDLNMFTRQFSTLQRAGLPILSTLGALEEESTNKILKNAIGEILKDIKGGTSLSSALEKHPKIFDALYINMIKASEASGTLDTTLERLAVLGENEERIRLQIKSATRYPVIVILAIVTAFLILTTLIVPRFAKLYHQFNAALPLPTQILLAINYVVTKFWWLAIILAVFFLFLFNKFISTKIGRRWWDNLKLRVPVFGPLILKLTMSRFTRITGTLMQSGITILNILDLTRGGVGNVIIARIIENIKKSVNEGRGMVEPMKASKLFPPIVTQMVAVGEETGKVDELLLHVADYYDSQIDYTVTNLITLIEPILILILGAGVLFLALGIFLPIWNLIHVFKR